MIRSIVNYQLIFILVFVLDLFSQVVSEYCASDVFCESPFKCCANKKACCYDHDNNSYTRGFKLHVWNMWYFWLVIIFILMSCFGGCGYYRRRRLAAMQQSVAMPQNARTVCAVRTRRHPPQPGFYAYTGPGVHTSPEAQLPPPYTEVMQQPNLYPVNKVDLPPYPGPPDDKDSSTQVNQGDDEVSPPPYYQVASLSSPPVQGGHSPVPRDHVAVPMESESSQQHVSGDQTDRTTQPSSSN